MTIWMDGVKNMSKYDKMLEENQKRSTEKISLAKQAIQQQLMEQERISVPKLMKMTGLSRGFFYKNQTIRELLDRAVEKQQGMPDPRKDILNQAMDRQIELLQQQLTLMKKENDDLKKENKKLQGILKQRDLRALKNL